MQKYPAILQLVPMDGEMTSSAILFLLLTISCYGCYGENEDPSDIKWPNKYHFKYEVIHVLDGITEKIEAWYIGKYNMGRMDMQGGIVKKYYTDNKLYVIHPESNNHELNEISCFKNKNKSPIDVLPDVLSGLEFQGKTRYNKMTVDFWQVKHRDQEVSGEVTLYVYKKGRYHIPLYQEIKTFDVWTGALDSHEITNYYYYDPRVSKDDVDVDKEFDTSYCSKTPSDIDLETDLDYMHHHNLFDFNFVFHGYKHHHGKNYTDEKEHEMRSAIFRNNWRKVVNHNKKNLSYKMGLNYFADRTPKELKQVSSCLHSSEPFERGTHTLKASEVEQLAEDLPKELDMRLLGALTPVKNQLSCGSCWSFATTAAVEGALALGNGGRNLDLSEQSLIDCAWGYKCLGCHGGELSGAFRYVYTHGVTTERDYGLYLIQDGFCHMDNVSEVFNIEGFGRITPRSELGLKTALHKYGPVAVAMYVSYNMYLYTSGVFYDINCTTMNPDSVNHGVTVVGYGERDGETYWIVKNSWGAKWGEAGYVLLSANDNNCFLEDEGYYAVV